MGRGATRPFDLPIAVAGGFFGLYKTFIDKNPTAKATAPLLQIQMARFATPRLKVPQISNMCAV